MTDAGPSLSRFTAPWQLEIVPTSTAAAAPLSPAARTIASPSSTASTANVPTPNTWWRHTNSGCARWASPYTARRCSCAATTCSASADGGLDAVRRAEPVRKGDVAGVVGRGGAAVVRRAKRSRDGCHGDRALGPALARPRQDPLKHEVRHQRRGDDVVLRLARPRPGGGAEERGEVDVPRRDRKRPVGRLSELRPRAAGGVAVHDDHPPESGLPLVLRLGELTGVERAVAAAPDDDHVPHHDDVAHRINRPPSTTSVVPVT